MKCESCKTTIDYVIKTGKLGCAKCYDIFHPVLRELITQLNFKHIGKKPKSFKIRELEDKMTAAALEGRFEDAEKLRKEIKNV